MRVFTILIVLTILNVTNTLNGFAYAQTIAIIDMQKVLQKSKVWVVVRKKTEERALQIKKQVTVKQEKIEGLWFKIQNSRRLNNSSATKETLRLEKKFQEQSAILQKFAKSKKTTMESAFLKARKTILLRVKKIVTEIALKEKFDIVFDTSASNNNFTTLYVKSKYSITNMVLVELNKTMASIKMDFKRKGQK